MDKYAFVLADLLKRNTELHGAALKQRGKKVLWPAKTRVVCLTEIRAIKADAKLKAFSAKVWWMIKGLNVTTRCIYALLLQWAVLLSDKKLFGFYTEDYESLILELQATIEGGAEGEAVGINPDEILKEWEFMKQYLIELHELVEKFEIN